MKFLITGATGFIGQYVVAEALQRGHEVTALVRSIDKAKQVLPANPKLQFIAVNDLQDFDTEKAAGFDRLVHLAWGEVGKYSDPNNLLGNLEPQFKFLQKVIAAGLRDITVAGTCLEYGKTEGDCKEDVAYQPVTYYGLAKLALYDMVQMLSAQYPDLKLKWLRYFYVYGIGQRPQALLSQLLAAIERKDESFNMSPGDQKRDFIHVGTLAHNTLCVAEQSDVLGVINVGNGVGMPVMDFVTSVLAQKKAQMQLNNTFYGYPGYEPFAFWGNTEKLRRIPGTKFDLDIQL